MRQWTPDQMVERYNKGFGRGEGVHYRPWLGAGDVPSKGVVTEFRGRKVDRIHVALSNLEHGAILAAQRIGRITDIREQFPLWPIEETEAIAASLGVTHPVHPRGGNVLMTTDILLTADGQHKRLEPITVKPESELKNSRVLEKFEIERLYWDARGGRLGIVTGRELPEALVRNLTWIDDYHVITSETLSPAAIDAIGDHLFDRILANPDAALNATCAEADDRMGYGPGTSLGVVRHAISRKLWTVPLDVRIDPGAPIPTPARTMTMAAARAAGFKP